MSASEIFAESAVNASTPLKSLAAAVVTYAIVDEKRPSLTPILEHEKQIGGDGDQQHHHMNGIPDGSNEHCLKSAPIISSSGGNGICVSACPTPTGIDGSSTVIMNGGGNGASNGGGGLKGYGNGNGSGNGNNFGNGNGNGNLDGQRNSLSNLQNFRAYSADDFLSRVNMNDKINNILRIPTKNANGVRQRSIYTSSMPQGRSSGGSLGAGGNGSSSSGGLTPKEPMRTPLSSGRQIPMPVHMTTLSPHGPSYNSNGYDSPLDGRSPISGMGRNVFVNRYQPAPSLSPIFGYNNDIIHLGGAPAGTTPSCLSPSHVAQQFPQPMPPPPYAMGRVSAHRADFESRTPSPCPGAGPIAMANGTIQLRLRDGIRIDMTLDKAVRVLNQRSMVSIALSRNCSNSALIHPNGRVLQSGSKVEIVTYDGMKSNNYVRFAKMWYKGVSFTSESCALIYLVDTAGTRTTTDSFTDLTKDYTLTVFYDDSRHGPSYVQDANEVIQNSTYSCTDEGTEIYEINGFRITQAADGLVKLTRTHNKCLIRTSPGNGSATLTTPGIHCTASLGKTSHLFVRRNEKRMHFDGSCFIVRNAGHSAGFNENNLLIVY